jgi:hypothetical protein
MGGRSVVGVGVGAHQASSGRVGVGVGPSKTRTGSMVGVGPSKASTGSVMGVTSRQARIRRMPKPSFRVGSSVAGVGMLSSSYPTKTTPKETRPRSDQPFTILSR